MISALKQFTSKVSVTYSINDWFFQGLRILLMGEHEISQVSGDSRGESQDVMIYNESMN